MVVEQLTAAIDRLAELDVDTLDDGELHDAVVELHRQTTRLASVTTQLAGAWDARRIWAADGSKSPGARLARETRCAPYSTNATVRRSRKLRAMPETAAAFADGDVSTDQVDLLCRVNSGRLHDDFAGYEDKLVRDAKRLCFKDLERVVRYWQHHVDPDGADERAHRQHEARHAHACRTFDGTVDLRATMTPVEGTIFLRELQRLETELFEADWAVARAEHGDRATVDDLARTPAQRRHDALVEMARRSAARPGNARPARPLINVLVNYEAFAGAICELGDGTVITPKSILPLLDEAEIRRIVFSAASEVIDVGRRLRFFTEAQRAAVIARDRHCQHPASCDVPAEDCQVDHRIPWIQGGSTDLANGRAYCKTHNGRDNLRGPPHDEAA